ncbi:MAG: hypothetical protein K2P99_05430 [Burkholderiales bacterium]|nr:hypothetical protein [Burkholderiales bacterium]
MTVLNTYLPVESEYKKKLPVDNRVIDLPLFLSSGESMSEKLYMIDEAKRKVVKVSNYGGEIPRDFDQKVYFALVQVSIDFKNKMYNTLRKKIHDLIYITDYYDSSRYYTPEEFLAITHKQRINNLYEKIEFVKFALENIQKKTYPVYNLSKFNIELLLAFKKDNIEFSVIIDKLIDKNIEKEDLELITKLLENQEFVKCAKFNKVVELVNDLISKRISKSDINELLNDYDFLNSADMIPTEIYFTYYDIAKYLGQQSTSSLNKSIYDSLKRMRDTKYEIWNCAYDSSMGKIVDMIDCSFINSIEVTQRENLKEFTQYMEYTGITKANAIIKIKLENFFILNLVEQKGHILFELNTIMHINNPTARKLYMYADKNRWWMGFRDFKTDKKIRLTLEDLLQKGIININASSAVPSAILRINRALDYLVAQNLISSYEFFKAKPQIKSYFELIFANSRDINPSQYINNSGVIAIKAPKKAIQQKSQDLFSDNVDNKLDLNNDLKTVLQDYDLTLLPNDLVEKFNKLFMEHGMEYFEYAIKYTELEKRNDSTAYLITCINKKYHLKFMYSEKTKIKKAQEKVIEENQQKENKKLEEQKLEARKNETKSNFYKSLPDLQDRCRYLAIKINNTYKDMYFGKMDDHIEELTIEIFAVSHGYFYRPKLSKLYADRGAELNIFKTVS